MQWKTAPLDEAFGPEKPTWARLEMRVGDAVLTRHSLDGAFLAPDRPVEDAIEGPLSGLAEWMVDNLPFVLWESHVPVPKLDASKGFRSGLPSLATAANWWRDVGGNYDLARIAGWQARHTLGAAASQLAVPSMVFVPEAGRVGLYVSLPPADLDPSIRLHLPSDPEEYWLERADLRDRFERFVEAALQRGGEDLENARWVNWLSARWVNAKAKEASEVERRRLRFGEVVSSAWEQKIAPLADEKAIVEGVLSDVEEIESDADLTRLLAALRPTQSNAHDGAAWKRLVAKSPLGLAKPYEEGYELARKVRHDLKLGTDPIDRVDILLSNLDISDREVDSGRVFRSACRVEGKQATIMVDTSVSGVTARRVALTTAFGRLLCDSRGKMWGAAFGEHARVQETRRAGAFAAELLAPAAIVPKYATEPQLLAEDYGISRSAADWRIHNVMRQTR